MNRLTLLAFLLVFAALAHADTLVFNNGDRLTGTIISSSAEEIIFKSDLLGDIAVPADQASVMTAVEEAAVIDVAAAQSLGVAPSPPLPAPEDEETAEEAEQVNAFDQAILKAKSYVDTIVPQGWSGKFNFGVSFVDTNTTSEAWNAKFAAKKESGKHEYGVGAFYNFSSQVDSAGVQSKTLDKWGGNFRYSYDLSERWFIQSDTEYLRDLVKNIDHQITETISAGYKVIDEEDFKFTILPGTAGQYQEAQGVDQKWYWYATLGDELMYRFSEIFRVEQSATVRVDPTDVGDYQLAFNAAFIARLTEWIDASLNYQYTYQSVVGTNSPNGEQQIIFALGVPF